MSARETRDTIPSNRNRTPRGRPTLAEAERCRQRILGATTAVFLEKGFERASMDEIAQHASASKQTLYSLFPTKADLFTGVMSAYAEQLFCSYRSHLELKAPPRRTLTETGRLLLKTCTSKEFLALHRILLAESSTFPHLARSLWNRWDDGYDLLSEYLNSCNIGGPNFRTSAVQFVLLVLRDSLICAMCNPDFVPHDRMIWNQVREAVDDFLRLHPAFSANHV